MIHGFRYAAFYPSINQDVLNLFLFHEGASLKIIQLLQHFEHLVSPLAQAVESFVIDFGARRIVADIIRYDGNHLCPIFWGEWLSS